MNVLTDEQRNGIRAAILNSEAAWGSLNVPWRGMTAERVAALTDNELRVYGSWMGSISDAVGQVRAQAGQVGNGEMVVNAGTCSGCGGEPGACQCHATNAEGADGIEASMVIHADGAGNLMMGTIGEDGSLPFDVEEPPARPAPSYLGAAGPPPMVGSEAGPVVSSEMMESLFRKGFEARLTVNSQLRSGALRSVKGEREQRATVVNRKDLDYLPPVTAEMFGWPR